MTEILTAHPIWTSGPLGTPADFEMALSYAVQGAIVSDTGLEPEVLEALDRVRDAAPNPPKQLVDAGWMPTYARPLTDHEGRDQGRTGRDSWPS